MANLSLKEIEEQVKDVGSIDLFGNVPLVDCAKHWSFQLRRIDQKGRFVALEKRLNLGVFGEPDDCGLNKRHIWDATLRAAIPSIAPQWRNKHRRGKKRRKGYKKP